MSKNAESPSWRDPALGTMKRVGLWLFSEVGEGNDFTLEELQEALPEPQVSRRMRDLRNFNWEIEPHDRVGSRSYLLRRVGIHVWEPGATRQARTATLTRAQRIDILQRDGYKCTTCGIGPGEMYPSSDSHVFATLDVARARAVTAEGAVVEVLRTQCARCNVEGHAGRPNPRDPQDVREAVGGLSAGQRAQLLVWIMNDSRTRSEVEKVWDLYRTLPVAAKQDLAAYLGQLVEAEAATE
ncbi:hypothetical protein AB0O82_10845 [Kitasatospora sp. NPDC088264]|uniref:hypothetical protein n=1 Tax=Kitasatospora sp. NPDC088264 TaxID=3155296 RepID=UPI00341762FD